MAGAMIDDTMVSRHEIEINQIAPTTTVIEAWIDSAKKTSRLTWLFSASLSARARVSPVRELR